MIIQQLTLTALQHCLDDKKVFSGFSADFCLRLEDVVT